MKRAWLCRGTIGVLMFAGIAGHPAHGAETKCRLRFTLEGWSVFYKSATGSGTINCDNGQSAHVSIKAKGGGLTVGMSKIANGSGTFSEVADIEDTFGTYAAAEAHAGMGKSSDAQVVTKGSVSLALSGTGKGIDLGVGFGKFVIEKKRK